MLVVIDISWSTTITRWILPQWCRNFRSSRWRIWTRWTRIRWVTIRRVSVLDQAWYDQVSQVSNEVRHHACWHQVFRIVLLAVLVKWLVMDLKNWLSWILKIYVMELIWSETTTIVPFCDVITSGFRWYDDTPWLSIHLAEQVQFQQHWNYRSWAADEINQCRSSWIALRSAIFTISFCCCNHPNEASVMAWLWWQSLR